jgi:glycosyltransferase involved in cell wall biosynthesis
MVIGFDASRAFEEESTGTENYSFQLLREMLSIDTVNEYYIYTRIHREKINLEFSRSVKVVHIGIPRLWTQIGLARHTFKDPLDVLFVPAHTIPLVRRANLPTVMTVHDLGAEYLPSSHQLKQQLYLKFITKYQLRSASHLIAVSEATKQDLVKKIKIPASKVSVVYEGVNFKSADQPAFGQTVQTLSKMNLTMHKYFLFVGTIQPRKNLIRLIEAFSLFLIENKHHEQEISLVLAGKLGWDYKEILALPKQLGIENQVKFCGRVSDRDLASLYQGALALTYPSLFEGFGLPILEAYFFNCPVITSNTSSMPEIAGKGAILVNPEEVNGIMRAMQIVYQDKQKRSELAKFGREQLKKFSWTEAAKATIKVLETTAREGK